MKYLVTGTAGFIGYYIAKHLLDRGDEVIGIDNVNDYYSPLIKEERLKILKKYPNFVEKRIDISDKDKLKECFENYKIDIVCHLAAQAGVRYSLKNPFAYQKSNLEGFVNIIEFTKNYNIKKFVYASSSSVYGNIKEIPYNEEQRIDTPISLYAATKKANELIAYTYTHLFDIQTIGLRFFTVYGPWGRPDMAIWKFTYSILNDKPIKLFNYGKNKRDFTYIDDIVKGVIASLDNNNLDKYEIINLGNNSPYDTITLVNLLEKNLGKKALKEFVPPQPGDMVVTYADIEKAKKKLGFSPTTPLEEGIKKFTTWFKNNKLVLSLKV